MAPQYPLPFPLPSVKAGLKDGKGLCLELFPSIRLLKKYSKTHDFMCWLLKSYLFLFYVSVFFFLHICLCTMCLPRAHGGHNRVSDPLELELWRTVSYHAGAEIQTWVFRKSTKCS